MQHVIILNNSSVFALDGVRLYKPERRRVSFLLNEASYQTFCQKSYHHLFEAVYIVENWDEENIKEIISGLIHEGEDVKIITDVERCVPLAGALNTFFNLNGLKDGEIKRYYDKSMMHDVLSCAGIATPKSLIYNEDAPHKAEDFFKVCKRQELFIKPRNGTNSTDIARISSVETMKEWMVDKARDGRYLIQPFIDLPMYHIDSLVHQGRVYASFCGEYTFPVATAYDGKHAGSILLPQNHPKSQRLTAFSRQVLSCLFAETSSYSGALHMEVFMDNHDIVFLEVGARSPGGPLMKLYHDILALDFVTEGLLTQIEESYSCRYTQEGRYGAHFWLGYPKDGKGNGLAYKPFWQDMPVLENAFVYENKRPLNAEQEAVERIANHAGSLLIYGNDFESVYKDFKKIRACSP